MQRKQPDPNCEICGGTGETEVYGKPEELAPCACTLPDDSDDLGMDLGGGSKPVRPIAPLPTNTDSGGTGAKIEEPVPSPIDALPTALTH